MTDYPENVRCFRAVKYFRYGGHRVVKNNLTITEARARANDSKSKDLAHDTPAWFIGFDWMPGCAPDRRCFPYDD